MAFSMKRDLLHGLVAAFLLAAPAAAWNDFGHEVVTGVAWQELEPEVRARAVALLRQAPADSLMDCLDLNEDVHRRCGRFAYRLDAAETPEDADRLLFERAGYWPDLARGLEKYNRPTWHYIGWTWRQGSDGTAHDTDLPVPEPNAVSQIEELARSVGDASSPAGRRGIHLAWLFHLVGDVHQPLHAASRVTERRDEREGDRGGNGFLLDEWNRNLHAFWDGALDGPRRSELRRRVAAELLRGSTDPPTPDQFRAAFFAAWDREYEALKERFVADARERHPLADAARAGLKSGEFEAWALESNGIVREAVYPPDLVREEAPSDRYTEMASRVSLERAALAGYRLADLLRELLGGSSGVSPR